MLPSRRAAERDEPGERLAGAGETVQEVTGDVGGQIIEVRQRLTVITAGQVGGDVVEVLGEAETGAEQRRQRGVAEGFQLVVGTECLEQIRLELRQFDGDRQRRRALGGLVEKRTQQGLQRVVQRFEEVRVDVAERLLGLTCLECIRDLCQGADAGIGGCRSRR